MLANNGDFLSESELLSYKNAVQGRRLTSLVLIAASPAALYFRYGLSATTVVGGLLLGTLLSGLSWQRAGKATAKIPARFTSDNFKQFIDRADNRMGCSERMTETTNLNRLQEPSQHAMPGEDQERLKFVKEWKLI